MQDASGGISESCGNRTECDEVEFFAIWLQHLGAWRINQRICRKVLADSQLEIRHCGEKFVGRSRG
jgi:hypothetical protein